MPQPCTETVAESFVQSISHICQYMDQKVQTACPSCLYTVSTKTSSAFQYLPICTFDVKHFVTSSLVRKQRAVLFPRMFCCIISDCCSVDCRGLIWNYGWVEPRQERERGGGMGGIYLPNIKWDRLSELIDIHSDCRRGLTHSLLDADWINPVVGPGVQYNMSNVISATGPIGQSQPSFNPHTIIIFLNKLVDAAKSAWTCLSCR